VKIKEKTVRIALPLWLFLPVQTAYCEMLLHIWTTNGFQPGRMLAVAAFSLGFGGLLALIASLLPKPGGSKWAGVCLSAAVAVACLLEYFILDAYKTFMPPVTIISGAGGVAGEFLGIVLSLLTRDFWRIGLMLLPSVLYALFCRCEKTRWKGRAVLAAAVAAAYLLGFGAVKGLTRDDSRFGSSYDFDSAVRCFGLNMALALETVHTTGGEAVPAFEAPSVVLTPAPTAEQPALQPSDGPEPTAAYGENAFDVDYAALAESARDPSTAAIYGYLAVQRPSKQNAYTGLFKGKNLILITAEAFTEEVIDPQRTPTLYRLATEGIHFTDYYQPAWGASTTSGEFSNLMGIVPTNGGMCMKETLQQNLFLTMGHQLRRLGYHSTAYHNHNKDFYDRNKTHAHLGYDKFLAQYGGLEGITPVWPESDLEMIDVTVPQYIGHQPFSVYYMTVSGHCMYSQKSNAMAKKHYDEVADMDCSEAVKCYYGCQLELEAAMSSLVRQLEEAGIADDTVIVLATDHYPYGLERSGTWKNTSDYLRELYGVENYDNFIRDHNALILWSGCLEDRDIQIDDPVYSLDILPTLSNLFGVEYDSRLLVGRDIFSEEPPLVLWPDRSWATERGRYDGLSGTFTPAEGYEPDEAYIEAMSQIVDNKIAYSRAVLDTDFFNDLAPVLGR